MIGRTALAATLAERLAARAGEPVPRPGDAMRVADATMQPAAVLIAITDRPSPGVILTQRPDTMTRHAGQVAFPGGRVDPGDADPDAAALREAWEEVALPPAAATIIGRLPDYATITGYRVTPVVAVVTPDLPLRPDPREVAALFEVPLDWLLDSANHVARWALYEGERRDYLEMQWQDRRIWGATAAMIANLAARIG